MDATDLSIVFDESGMCDHCNTYYNDIRPNWNPNDRGWGEISKIADKIKKEGKGKEFD